MAAVHALHPPVGLEDLIAATVARAVEPVLAGVVERLVAAERSRRISWRIAEAADLLGISESAVRRLVTAGTLPHVRLAGITVIPDDALRARIAELATT